MLTQHRKRSTLRCPVAFPADGVRLRARRQSPGINSLLDLLVFGRRGGAPERSSARPPTCRPCPRTLRRSRRSEPAANDREEVSPSATRRRPARGRPLQSRARPHEAEVLDRPTRVVLFGPGGGFLSACGATPGVTWSARQQMRCRGQISQHPAAADLTAAGGPLLPRCGPLAFMPAAPEFGGVRLLSPGTPGLIPPYANAQDSSPAPSPLHWFCHIAPCTGGGRLAGHRSAADLWFVPLVRPARCTRTAGRRPTRGLALRLFRAARSSTAQRFTPGTDCQPAELHSAWDQR